MTRKKLLKNKNSYFPPGILTLAGTIALMSSSPAQSQVNYFERYRRPISFRDCTTQECWLDAAKYCEPVIYNATLSIEIATATAQHELWGPTATDQCIYFQEVQSLQAFGQDAPVGRGLQFICVYESGDDLVLEWEVFFGKRSGTLGATAGMADPATNISPSTKSIDDRHIASCQSIMP